MDPVKQPVEMTISGLYQGKPTVTAAKNDSLGAVKDMTFRIVQNNNGTATLIINENTVEGSYNPETREFYMEYAENWRLGTDYVEKNDIGYHRRRL